MTKASFDITKARKAPISGSPHRDAEAGAEMPMFGHQASTVATSLPSAGLMSSAGINDFTPAEQRLIFASSSPDDGAHTGPVEASTGLDIDLGLFGGAISVSGSLEEYISLVINGSREASISPPFAVTNDFTIGAEQPTIFGGAKNIGPVSVSDNASLVANGTGVGHIVVRSTVTGYRELDPGNQSTTSSPSQGVTYVIDKKGIAATIDVTRYFTIGADEPTTYSAGQGVAYVIDKKGIAATIDVGTGAVTVDSSATATTILGRKSIFNFVASTSGNVTIDGGTGAATIFAGAGQDLTFIDGSNTTRGADIMAAGSGNETLNAGSAKSGVYMAIGSGSVDLIGSAAGDTIFGGSGDATITTNGGSDLFVFGSTAGGVGGTDLITDFNPAKDRVFLSGVTVASETAAGTGPAMITLSDGTKLTFTGITDASYSHWVLA